MLYAPICLFVFNRTDHLKRTVSSLLECPEAKDSDLIVFSDGPRIGRNDEEQVGSVREYLKTIRGFKSIEIRYAEVNMGLAKSIISGVSEIIENRDSVIVMEDDLVVSPLFLAFMNSALNFYENSHEVISIHGYTVPIETSGRNYFLRGADCWGWATWRRGWKSFVHDGMILKDKLENSNEMHFFDFNYTYPFFKMLKGQIKGRNNSWAIRWYASAFLEKKLTLYPAESLVENIGLDGSGSHCKEEDLSQSLSLDTRVLRFSSETKEESAIRKKIEKHYYERLSIKGKLLCIGRRFLSFI